MNGLNNVVIWDALFGEGDLSERDSLLAFWLAKQFVYEAPGSLFALIGRHNTRLNPELWIQMAAQVNSDDTPDRDVLSKWVSLLTITAAPSPNGNLSIFLANLVIKCANSGLLSQIIPIYDILAKPILDLSDRYYGRGFHMVGDHHTLTSIWEKCFKLHLEHLAEPLLRCITTNLESQHSQLCIWQGDSRNWSTPSWLRSAIEPHEQDRHPANIDALTNAARDCLQWLTANGSVVARDWADQQVNAEAPLLKRLAIHTIANMPSMDGDGKLQWLLANTDIHELPIHHEVFQTVKLAYPTASQTVRQRLIDAVSFYTWPNPDNSEKESSEAHHKFNWFCWLNSADP